jgi:hypothetical protein
VLLTNCFTSALLSPAHTRLGSESQVYFGFGFVMKISPAATSHRENASSALRDMKALISAIPVPTYSADGSAFGQYVVDALKATGNLKFIEKDCYGCLQRDAYLRHQASTVKLPQQDSDDHASSLNEDQEVKHEELQRSRPAKSEAQDISNLLTSMRVSSEPEVSTFVERDDPKFGSHAIANAQIDRARRNDVLYYYRSTQCLEPERDQAIRTFYYQLFISHLPQEIHYDLTYGDIRGLYYTLMAANQSTNRLLMRTINQELLAMRKQHGMSFLQYHLQFTRTVENLRATGHDPADELLCCIFVQGLSGDRRYAYITRELDNLETAPTFLETVDKIRAYASTIGDNSPGNLRSSSCS